MGEEGGELITKAIYAIKPKITLEVGFGCGISTLFVCDALAGNGTRSRHIVLDPYQSTTFRNIGLQNIRRAGYEHIIELYETPSELALPRLLAEGTRIQTAIIDGWHTFDHAMVDFFYINKMLDVNGIVILDDTYLPSIWQLTNHIRTYPAYEPFAAQAQPRVRTRARVRRMLSRALPSLRRPWDRPRCLAFRKVTQDTRNWDWHVEF